ncbi:MAG: hypothetical protein ACLRZ2_02110 [Veillonella sp.]
MFIYQITDEVDGKHRLKLIEYVASSTSYRTIRSIIIKGEKLEWVTKGDGVKCDTIYLVSTATV